MHLRHMDSFGGLEDRTSWLPIPSPGLHSHAIYTRKELSIEEYWVKENRKLHHRERAQMCIQSNLLFAVLQQLYLFPPLSGPMYRQTNDNKRDFYIFLLIFTQTASLYTALPDKLLDSTRTHLCKVIFFNVFLYFGYG